jgi:hypothetical protein
MKVVKVFICGKQVEEYPDCTLSIDDVWVRVKASGDKSFFDSVFKFPKLSRDISVIEMDQKGKK